MEKVVASFKRMSRADTSLAELASEIIRICQVPNWWSPRSGGRDYIYHGLLGERIQFQTQSPHTPEILMKLMAQAIVERDKTKVLAAALGFSVCRFGASRQTEFMYECARKANHKNAARLATIHLSARGPLSSDNNFICQAAWMLAGGESSVADEIHPVDRADVIEMLSAARERWKKPEPIPQWCCDGVHSAGNDVRFMGAWHHMYAVCKAFEHYGRVDPSDEWLPEFQCYDGLLIQEADATG
jgi:hypothetical protein